MFSKYKKKTSAIWFRNPCKTSLTYVRVFHICFVVWFLYIEEEKNKSSFLEFTNFSTVTGNAGGFAFCHGGTQT